MNMQYQFPRRSTLAVAVLTVFLTGCATFSGDGGLDSVSTMTKERTGQAVQFSKPTTDANATPDTVGQLLQKPLTPDTAVQIALLNNKGLKASFAELGVAEADLVQAGRMRNPSFSFGRMRAGEDVEIERSVMFDLLGLLTMPIRSGIEKRRFEQAQLQTASQAVQLAADTRRAYFNAVAAQQTATYMEQVQSAADAGAELSQRLARVGNVSKLDQAREQVFYADATAQVARARHNATAAREQLTRLMGLWGANASFKLPDRLPDLPKAPNEMANVEQIAMDQRLDIQIAKRDAHATARALGLTKATRFINVLDAGYANTSETGEPRSNGYEIELELPIFDWSGARTARAEAMYMQSVNRTADLAIRARSQVREAYSAYRTTYDLAKHYQSEVVPLRKKISEEVLLRYNGMLASVFELLTDARDQVSSVNAAIEAQRDFWIAETDLQAAMNGTGGSSVQIRTAAPAEAGAAEH
ncbi:MULTISPECIES: TolC family protein [Noviherbaspirillum]|jgi:outer membrane protein TolC|uniref:TolC family protein n=1 Tax=Noviherbaspirillum album TaxID=3080276 RepID=A0ABU6JGU3_9BURK|nr:MULTISPECIES: TolC family protein [Noviherbaspirillum]MEC4722888.1 TolC family protein [Noviherbaspirillum sp. CPCC 100848]